MNFSLTPKLEQFVRDRVESGDYNNASEVAREAIRLLKRVEERRALKLERLRAAIRDGLAAANSLETAYIGVTGATYFDEHGDCPKPASVAVVRDAEFVPADVQLGGN